MSSCLYDFSMLYDVFEKRYILIHVTYPLFFDNNDTLLLIY